MAYSGKEPIAIVGSACRLPGGADTPSKLWQLLRDPRDVAKDFGPDRLNLSSFYNKNGEHHGSTNVQNQSYLLSEDIRQFDRGFFNVNPREAEAMDPQQRMLLEVVYEAFESAGWALENVQGSQTSVFVGLMTCDWNDILARDPETAPTYAATGGARSILSNRLSYFYDLHGPSVTIDTACSSSLVALHQAVQSIRNNESSAAIVAGANLIMDPWMYIVESKLHMLSPRSRSRMWDKKADGYARGEGFASILLKPLSAALRDGDHVEALVRETGVNSDGRTKGITMPSSVAQASLIRQTYQNAGLDPVRDRCQYFECHGTGTPAGDPIEAEAIQKAFFSDQNEATSEDTLYVGSIKTVVGHLEGGAGIAGVLKAVLAMKQKTIPPNMHFDELSPAVRPFYKGVCIPTKAVAWPKVKGGVRRASVNSFGFGGTNAHAILESYEPSVEESSLNATTSISNTADNEECSNMPFLFSAQSETSLKSMIQHYAEFIRTHPDLSLHDLSWMLERRRSTFAVRAFFVGATREKLLAQLDHAVQQFAKGTGSEICHRYRLTYPTEVPGVLGIFTGQGAQWATMGTSLIQHSPLFQDSIRRQQAALDALPDGPCWDLEQELLASPELSKIGDAALSQPLCTALQVAMVDLMRASGIRLATVVGHSSGEIAAIYAAGMISAIDAIKIAYYRGLHSKLACGPNGEPGGMIAVGMSMAKAREFCSKQQFCGRLSVAASNSSGSVTLSGDIEAVKETKAILDDEGIFARQLVVDKAYHSHHMSKCKEAYLQSLKDCNITVTRPQNGTVWVSSVRGDTDLVDEDRLDPLAGQYWLDNMVQPVLFSQAIERSFWAGGPFELAIEVGPHSALKGPAMQIFRSILSREVPYTSMMRRKENEVQSVSSAVGYIWQYLGPKFVDLAGFRTVIEANNAQYTPRMLLDLPTYPWDHIQPYWKESRLSKQYRLRNPPAHELLGRLVPDSWEAELRWRNIVRLDEIPWLRGHVFQNQALFPTTGYIAMVIEAAKFVANGRPMRTIEIQDFEIPKALVLEEDSPGVETAFVFRQRTPTQTKANDDGSFYCAEFSCYACRVDSATSMERTCSGTVTIQLGSPVMDELPPRPDSALKMSPLDIDSFYTTLDGLGLTYQGLFRGLISGCRLENFSQVTGSWNGVDIGTDYTSHPALMDVGFHSVFAAYGSPASGHLWAPYLPVYIRRFTIDPNVPFVGDTDEVKIEAHGFITEFASSTIDCEVHLYNANDGRCGIIAEGLTLRTMYPPNEATDRSLFVEEVFQQDISTGLTIVTEEETQEELCAIEALERLSLYYWRKLLADLQPGERESLQWHHKLLVNVAEEFIESVQNDEHSYVSSEWLQTPEEEASQLIDKYSQYVDVQLVRAVGESLTSVLRGTTSLLEIMLADDLLDRFYDSGLGLKRINRYLAGAVQQITNRFPRTKILEIGAGTGGATRSIFEAVGDRYSSYMYTDISGGFFDKAAVKFKDQKNKIVFKELNIERDPTSQGYQEHSYDIVIASNVLHATKSLRETLLNARKLLRPGGFLVLMEVTGDLGRPNFIMGGLPGWWFGADEGRTHGPGIAASKWDRLLQATGYSGASHVLHDTTDPAAHSCSLIVSQAVDDIFDLVREPLAADAIPESQIVLVGGKSPATSKLAREIRNLLNRFNCQLTIVDGIDVFEHEPPPPNCSLLVIEELEKTLLAPPVSAKRMSAFKAAFFSAKDILWVTSGRTTVSPSSNMVVALLRTMKDELPTLNTQSLDFARQEDVNSVACVEAFLRLMYANSTAFLNHDSLWTIEPETIIDQGALMLSRVRPNTEANNRYNASRRAIYKQVDLNRHKVDLQDVDGKLELRENGPIANGLHINVNLSAPLPGFNTKKLYLCSGNLSSSGQEAVALTRTISSCEYVAEGSFLPLMDGLALGDKYLQSAAQFLVAGCILALLNKSTGAVLVFDPPAAIAQILSEDEIFVSGRASFAKYDSINAPKDWIKIHPRGTVRNWRTSLPENMKLAVDFNGLRNDSLDILRSLNCKVISSDDLILQADAMPDLLSAAISQAAASTCSAETECTPLSQLLGRPDSSISNCGTIQWPVDRCVNAITRPLDIKTMFKPDRTYLLAGLAGELGQSLCRFMVQNGARHVVLTSRSADPNAPWLKTVNSRGANVGIRKMDIADRRSIREVIEDMRKTMPPIAGVCNGAMVLIDSTFESMSARAMNDVLRPKVTGSTYLDQAFNTDTLDFFVLFSSMGTLIGNGGQSNYHAANLFMTGLAFQRKHRGLAGSVIDIGKVVDVGYVTRLNQQTTDRLRVTFWDALSEKDLRQLFAEAVIAGRPKNLGSSQLSMGLSPFIDTPSATIRPRWYSNPRFSQMVKEGTISEEKESSLSGQVSLAQQLEEAESDSAATDAVVSAFCAKLESTLQLPEGTVKGDVSLLEIGIDSLRAVEVRSWFLKQIQVDVPVLKILGQDTISQISQEAALKFIASHLQSSSTDRKQTSKKEDQQSLSAPKAPQSEKKSPNPLHSGETISQRLHASALSESGFNSKCFTHDDSGSSQSLGLSSKATPSAASCATSRSTTPPIEPDQDYAVPSKLHVDRPVESIPFIRKEIMSLGQARLWFLRELLSDKTTYNVVVSYKISGPLQVARFKRAFAATVAHHESLRTCYFRDHYSDTLYQGVRTSSSVNFTHQIDGDDSMVRTALDRYESHAWDLEHGDLIGATLITHNPESHTFVFGYHHIAVDGVSLGILLQNLSDSYVGKPLALPQKQPADFALHQNRHPSQVDREDMDFWKKEFSVLPEPLPLLPFARVNTRTDTQSYKSHTTTREISIELGSFIKNTSQALRISPFHFFLTAIQILYSKLIGVEEMCIGVTDANRRDEDYKNTVGFFLNLLPLRLQSYHEETFSETAKRTTKKARESLSHGEVPFELLLDEFKVPRSSEIPPLFQTVVNYRIASVIEIPLGECVMNAASGNDANNPYDLTWSITESTEGKAYIELTCLDSLYTANDGDIILKAYIHMLEHFAKQPTSRISDAMLFTSEDTQQALTLGQGAVKDFGWPSTLSSRFDEMRNRFPHAIAVKDPTYSTTYAELDAMAKSLALAIDSTGIKPGARVATICQPSAISTACLLGIMLGGFVYVPLDLSLPPARHAAMISACQASLILSDSTTLQAATKLASAKAIPLLNATMNLANSSQVPENRSEPHSPFCILHTSGSTGEPKAIELTQAGCTNFVAGVTDQFHLKQETILQQSSVGFDMSLGQIFLAIANGGTLVIVPGPLRGDIVGITDLIRKERVTLTVATPSEYLVMLDTSNDVLRQCIDWRFALLGGEPISKQLRHELHLLGRGDLSVINCYGPTETSLAASIDDITRSDIQDDDKILKSIGFVSPNRSINILDQHQRPVPCGYPGEIVIGGLGVSLGYTNVVEQNSIKFIKNEFAPREFIERGWDRAYRTGDKGKILEDGRLVLLGRMNGDTQVKVRGVRIELGDIERALLDATSLHLSAAVVTVRGDSKIIVAHVLFKSGMSLSETELQRLAAELPLPLYMRPHMILPLKDLPKTTNGKIDRRKIENLALPNAEFTQELQESLTLGEIELRLIWQELLQPPPEFGRIKPNSDFFVMGGNSLLLVKLQSVIKNSMGVEISIRELYAASTLRDMSSRIEDDKQHLPMQQIDWTQETKMPPAILPLSYGVRAPVRATGRQVVLTGITSFLGSKIARALLDDVTISRLHAVAVDSTNQGGLPRSEKLVVYTGSLSHPTLGLSQSQITTLESTADLIFHAGAQGHCLNNFASVRQPNLQSTVFLSQMALVRRVPLHFLSSNRVTLLTGEQEIPPVSVSELFPATDGSEGFTVSKWASERYLEHFARETNLPACIHRACIPIGDEAPNEDAVNAILLYSRKLCATPSFDNVTGYFDFEDVHKIAKSIAAETNPTIEHPDHARIVHHSSGVKIPVNAIGNRLEKLYGGSFSQLPAKEWLARAKESGLEPLITSYLEAMVEKGNLVTFPYLGKELS